MTTDKDLNPELQPMTIELGSEIKQFELGPDKAKALKSTFLPMLQKLEAYEAAYREVLTQANEGIDEHVIAAAKALRLEIRKIRTGAERTRKETKAESIRLGKAIDGIANIVKYAVTDKEERLQEIENHFEKLEAERLEKLQESRQKQLTLIGYEGPEKDWTAMDDQDWDLYCQGVIAQIEAAEREKKEKEAQKLAEQERQRQEAEMAEQKRLLMERELELARKEKEIAEQIAANVALENQKLQMAAKLLEAQAEETGQPLADSQLPTEGDMTGFAGTIIDPDYIVPADVVSQSTAELPAEPHDYDAELALIDSIGQPAANDFERLGVFQTILGTLTYPDMTTDLGVRIVDHLQSLIGQADGFIQQQLKVNEKTLKEQ